MPEQVAKMLKEFGVVEKKEKPTYKVSVSLVNQMMWYNNLTDIEKREETIERLEKTLKGISWGTPATSKGIKFEEDPRVLRALEGTDMQVWRSKVIDMGDFNLRLAGKFDSITDDKTKIYDLKRSKYFNVDFYADYRTVQHNYYFYLEKKADLFYYIIGVGEDAVEDIKVVEIQRPDEEVLEKIVKNSLTNFISFLEQHKLLELFKETQIYGGKF